MPLALSLRGRLWAAAAVCRKVGVTSIEQLCHSDSGGRRVYGKHGRILGSRAFQYICVEPFNQTCRLKSQNFESILELLIDLRDLWFKREVQNLCMTSDCRSAARSNESKSEGKDQGREKVMREIPEVRECAVGALLISWVQRWLTPEERGRTYFGLTWSSYSSDRRRRSSRSGSLNTIAGSWKGPSET